MPEMLNVLLRDASCKIQIGVEISLFCCVLILEYPSSLFE